MIVYTYFEPLSTIDVQDEGQLATLWRRSWAASEFSPVVLTSMHAAAHPKYEQFLSVIERFPSINPAGYDRACWLRWLALDVVGGGLMTDYDVICRAFSPEFLQFPHPVVVLDRGGVPCAVQTTAEGATRIVDDIIAYPHRHDGRHYSDMFFFQAKNYPREGSWTAPFNSPEFPHAPAVHFSHSDCGALAPNVKRFITVRKLMFPEDQLAWEAAQAKRAAEALKPGAP